MAATSAPKSHSFLRGANPRTIHVTPRLEGGVQGAEKSLKELLLDCYHYVTPRLEEGVEGVLVVAEEERVVAHRAHGQP